MSILEKDRVIHGVFVNSLEAGKIVECFNDEMFGKTSVALLMNSPEFEDGLK